MRSRLNSKLEHGLRKLQDRAPPVVSGAIDGIIDRAIPAIANITGGSKHGRGQLNEDAINNGMVLAPRSAPPTKIQTYGPEVEGPDHEVRQAFFKYSQCNGKKRALLVSNC